VTEGTTEVTFIIKSQSSTMFKRVLEKFYERRSPSQGVPEGARLFFKNRQIEHDDLAEDLGIETGAEICVKR
jgi:hypothetical protein